MEFTQGATCGRKTKLKAKCKSKGCGSRLQAIAKKAQPDSILIFRYDGGNDKQAKANRKGKAKVRWCPVSGGKHTVEIVGCELSREVSCK